MIIILSPSKSLNYKLDSPTRKFSNPIFLSEANKLVRVLKNFSPANLRELLNISNGLGELNYLRFQKWEPDHNPENSKQALFTFSGEVYSGLDAYNLTNGQINFAQNHVRILSGLYGMLCPLDLVQPYRLEMGTQISFDNYKNLYQYWDTKLSNALNSQLDNQKSKTIINLASNEYSKAARLKKINGTVINIVFKEYKGDDYKIITVYAKKARGYMTRYIIENKITEPEQLKLFDVEGYNYSESLSDSTEWVFTR
jgi:cytoplasmic iron level regulating protein YaaA (DUF328/UPF0246 family)